MAIKMHLAPSGGFIYVANITQEVDALVAWQITFFYVTNILSQLADFFLLLLELRRCIRKCLRKWKKREAIEYLERTKEEAMGTEEPCPICYVEFGEGEEMYRPRCGHLFHKQCLSRWMGKQANCPLCRVEVS